MYCSINSFVFILVYKCIDKKLNKQEVIINIYFHLIRTIILGMEKLEYKNPSIIP